MIVKTVTRIARIAEYHLLQMNRRPDSCFRAEFRPGSGGGVARGGDTELDPEGVGQIGAMEVEITSLTERTAYLEEKQQRREGLSV